MHWMIDMTYNDDITKGDIIEVAVLGIKSFDADAYDNLGIASFTETKRKSPKYVFLSISMNTDTGIYMGDFDVAYLINGDWKHKFEDFGNLSEYEKDMTNVFECMEKNGYVITQDKKDKMWST